MSAAARAIALVFFTNGLLLGAWATRIPTVRDELGLSAGELGIALAAVAAGAVLAMPLSGAWSAHAGSRPPTRVMLLVFCAAPVLAAAAPSFGLLLGAGLLLGVGNGALDVAMNAQGATIERRRGRLLLGRLHAAFSAGGLVGAATGALAVGAGLSAEAHLGIAGALGALVVFPLTASLVRGDDDPERAGPRFARPSRPLLALGVLAFCCLLAEGAALDWSAVYVEEDLAADAAVAALAYAAFSATMLAGRLVADRLVAAVDPVVLLRAGGLVAGGGLGVALALDAPAAALAGFALLGAGLSVVIPLTFRAATRRGGAPSLAAVSTLGYFGLLAGPPLVGAVAEATSLGAGLACVAVLAASPLLLGGAVRP